MRRHQWGTYNKAHKSLRGTSGDVGIVTRKELQEALDGSINLTKAPGSETAADVSRVERGTKLVAVIEVAGCVSACCAIQAKRCWT